MFCKYCGEEIHDNAVVCVSCGCATNDNKTVVADPNASQKDWVATLLLCFFIGGFGAHRFYVGKVGTGILQLLTLGACGIWTLVDLIIILCGKFTDAEGKVIKNS